ncbi:hypothetical protein [Azospirillum doebereinerae]
MLEMLALALVLSVFAGTVHHLLVARVGAAQAASEFTTSPLRRVNPVDAETPDEAPPGPSWASFPRAF